jgi:serine kinase of HPr protein (carbohydrate metabolism regulator)
MAMLKSERKALLLLLKVRKYVERAQEDDSFRHQMLMLILRAGEDAAEIIIATPDSVRKAVAALAIMSAANSLIA